MARVGGQFQTLGQDVGVAAILDDWSAPRTGAVTFLSALKERCPKDRLRILRAAPTGVSTSHGTIPAYRLAYAADKPCSISSAAVPSKGVRAYLCAAAVEPTLLP